MFDLQVLYSLDLSECQECARTDSIQWHIHTVSTVCRMDSVSTISGLKLMYSRAPVDRSEISVLSDTRQWSVLTGYAARFYSKSNVTCAALLTAILLLHSNLDLLVNANYMVHLLTTAKFPPTHICVGSNLYIEEVNDRRDIHFTGVVLIFIFQLNTKHLYSNTRHRNLQIERSVRTEWCSSQWSKCLLDTFMYPRLFSGTCPEHTVHARL
jgi:hypothetical protein